MLKLQSVKCQCKNSLITKNAKSLIFYNSLPKYLDDVMKYIQSIETTNSKIVGQVSFCLYEDHQMHNFVYVKSQCLILHWFLWNLYKLCKNVHKHELFHIYMKCIKVRFSISICEGIAVFHIYGLWFLHNRLTIWSYFFLFEGCKFFWIFIL